MTETNLVRELMCRATSLGSRLFRNNVAKAWVGKSHIVPCDKTYILTKGTVVIENPRRLHAGLCKGSHDLIGWTPVKITEEHVGKTISVFTAVEAKTKSGKATKEQINFKDAVNNSGGISLIAKHPDDLNDHLLQ